MRSRWGRAGAAVLIALALGSTVAAAGPRSSRWRRAAPAVPEASIAGDGPAVASADPFTAEAPGLSPGQIEMTTISTRPTLVTGPEVRVEVRGLANDDHLTVARDGTNVSNRFGPIAGRPGVRQGVVGGLRLGANRLDAVATGATYGRRAVTLRVVDHPIAGPVISGPHQYPFVCETEQSGMGPPTDRDCSAPTRVSWYARDSLGQFHKLADPYAPYPASTSTTTVNGRTVPFVVRVESAVINRGVARIAVLDDPHARGPNQPFTPVDWNHRLVYHFGESCGTGYHQGHDSEDSVFSTLGGIGGTNLAGPFLDLPGRLGSGYMVAQSTLTVFGVHCNEILSAETLMMVREHIIDRYGVIDHTISGGASGGAIQQYTIADHYPGLLDAIAPLLSFPDVISTAMTVHDCVVMTSVFQSDPGRWNLVKQKAVTGLPSPQTCTDWNNLFAPNLQPTDCPSGIPASQVYNASTNPHGVRCDLQDDLRNVLGVDPSTGYALRPLDNVGVQYGLQALKSGAITADDFLALNRQVGGVDLDGKHTSARTSMPPALAARMYLIGAVSGRGGLNQVPIIDQSVPIADVVPELDIHDQIRPFELRARLDQRFGSHANQAIWSLLPLPSNALVTADQWLDRVDALAAANPSLSRAQAVAQARPSAAADQCRTGFVGVPVACDQGVLRSSSTRQTAGGPFREDNIKCQLQPVSRATEPAQLPDAGLDQLRQIFPDGVCDWNKAPVGWTAKSLEWQTITDPGHSETVPYPLVRSLVPSASHPSSGQPAVASPAHHQQPASGGGLLARTGFDESRTWLLLVMLIAAALAVARLVGRTRRVGP